MNARFSFSDTALDVTALGRSLADDGCGGFVSFEGWVRDHNEGQRVTRLEYEAFASLALREGERIIDEAVRRFGVRNARCVHRVGSLAIGECAVWVAVVSPHRGEAFAACRYIIDEVKHRVPIWKKEHYVGGDSGWVNCERCAAAADDAGHEHAHHHPHDHPHDHLHDHVQDPAPAPRAGAATFDYSRQTLLPEVGAAGQAKLGAARVLVVGAGGLGCPVLQYLAGAGVGHLTVVDGDRVEASNLHRQPLYAFADVGRWKATVAAERLRAQNPAIDVQAEVQLVEAGNVDRLVATHDLVIDCTDNFRAKFLLNDAAVRAATPAIFASIHQYEGQLQVVRADRGGSCLRCLWPDAPADGVVGNCRESGVLGAVPAVLGGLQAVEALKLLLDLPGQQSDALLLVNLLDLTQRRLRAPRARACLGRDCVRCAAPAAASDDLEFDADLDAARSRGLVIVDIRDDDEVRAAPLPGGALHIAMPRLLARPALLAAGDRYLLVCSRGLRSRTAAEQLRAAGLARVWSLRGGLAGTTRASPSAPAGNVPQPGRS
jgi:molybdopterin/thiamine biosynthesis adenylyltransferase/molybdopterin synthase catalytic subunit/rhodanese-related sulfurtransferase